MKSSNKKVATNVFSRLTYLLENRVWNEIFEDFYVYPCDWIFSFLHVDWKIIYIGRFGFSKSHSCSNNWGEIFLDIVRF